MQFGCLRPSPGFQKLLQRIEAPRRGADADHGELQNRCSELFFVFVDCYRILRLRQY